jgi:hypothetical protein
VRTSAVISVYKWSISKMGGKNLLEQKQNVLLKYLSYILLIILIILPPNEEEEGAMIDAISSWHAIVYRVVNI